MQGAGLFVIGALIVTLSTCVTTSLRDKEPEPRESEEVFYLASESELRLKGSATIGDWEAASDRIDARFEPGLTPAQVRALVRELERAVERDTARDAIDLDLTPRDEPRVRLNVAVESLRSGKPGMERDMRDALRAEAHPHVIYALERVKDVDWRVEDQPGQLVFEMTTEGDLSLAGVEKRIAMDVRIEPMGDDRFRVIGRRTFDMETFNIEPPTAFFGLIKADPTVEVVFDLVIQMQEAAPDAS